MESPEGETSYSEEENLVPIYSSRETRKRRKRIATPLLPTDSRASSLDFERVINEYSIQATRDRLWRPEEIHYQQSPLVKDKASHKIEYSTFRPDSFTIPPPPPITRLRPAKKKTPLGYTGRTATRWVLTNLTGVLTGLTSIVVVVNTDIIQSWRLNLLDFFWRNQQSYPVVFVLYSLTNLTLALLSAALCVWIAPEAIGSGIPEVKAYLNGVRVKRFSSVRLFCVKIVGTILSISSGLAIGPEGPTVHIGAIIGASCTKFSNVLLRVLPRSCSRLAWAFVTTDLSHFSTDAERRDLVSIGAAAGFAAAFGAPIGGLLFSMEEASTYFDHNMFLKTLSATALATFCLAMYHGDLSDYSIISLGSYNTPNQNIFLNRIEELPLYIIIAVIGGLLGGCFCRVWKFLQVTRQRMAPQGTSQKIWQLIEVAIVSILTSTITYWVPLMEWTCKKATSMIGTDAEKESVVDPWKFRAQQFDCRSGEINELATIFFGSREEAIKHILTNPAQFDQWTLWIVGSIFFVLMTLTLGRAIPSGIFMPTVLIGTSLGGAAGLVFQDWISPELSPSTFALLGAAALLAGIQRSTVSLCVILVEGTGQVKTLIPVIITIVIARYVADMVSDHGLYETAIEVKNYPYLDHTEKKRYDILPVRDIMSQPVVTLGPREQAQRLVKLLRETDHHGFPVVDPQTRRFIGLVRRDQIVALLECGVFDDATPSVGASWEHDDTDDSLSSVASGAATPTKWTPKPGVGKSPFMHLAYHIKDDRFEDILEENYTHIATKKMEEDDFDMNDWFLSIRHHRLLQRLPSSEEDASSVAIAGDPSLPPAPRRAATDTLHYAIVGTNQRGHVYVKWLNPDYKRRWICISAVMNLGTYCVNEFTPVSKAHVLFCALGLRHLIVLGGATGGEVVGILTRANLLKASLAEPTR